jgi:hypothetical protein
MLDEEVCQLDYLLFRAHFVRPYLFFVIGHGVWLFICPPHLNTVRLRRDESPSLQ